MMPLVVVVASTIAGAEAHAESTILPVHVRVEAPASCTDEDKFWAEVTSRTSELRRVPTTDETPELIVRAWRVHGAVRGELSLRTARGERLPPRGVVGRTCDEVTSALALALVLAMEEGALESKPPPQPEPEPEPEPEREPEPEPEREHGSRPLPLPRATPRPSSRDDDRPRRFEAAMGAHGILSHVDGTATGVGIFSEIGLPYLDGRLALRLEAATWRREVVRSVGEAELRWLFLRAQLCATPVRTLALSLCALADGGAFSASATHARNPLSYSAPWAGAGLATHAAWKWSSRFELEVEVGVLAPFVGDDLVLRPNVVLFSTPSVLTWAGIGPVLRFD
jgi:hypothetical protein